MSARPAGSCRKRSSPTVYSKHLLDWARWDADAVRDDVLAYVVEHLGEPDAVLVVDKTGFLKKGRHSVGVFLSYASKREHVLMGRELYLPKEWAGDRAPRKCLTRSNSPTKPQLEQQDLHFVPEEAGNSHVWLDLSGQKTVTQLAAQVQAQDWIALSAGDSAKGPRYYDWLRLVLLSWQIPGERWLLLHRLGLSRAGSP